MLDARRRKRISWLEIPCFQLHASPIMAPLQGLFVLAWWLHGLLAAMSWAFLPRQPACCARCWHLLPRCLEQLIKHACMHAAIICPDCMACKMVQNIKPKGLQ